MSYQAGWQCGDVTSELKAAVWMVQQDLPEMLFIRVNTPRPQPLQTFSHWFMDPTSTDKAAVLRVPLQRTARTALEQMDNATAYNARELELARQCPPDTPDADSMQVTTFMGTLSVDVKKFARAANLPEVTDGYQDYTAYLHTSEERKFAPVVIFIRGTVDTSVNQRTDQDSLGSLIDALKNPPEKRAIGELQLSSTRDGWHLYRNPRFNELMGLITYGYHYLVRTSAKSPGVNLQYMI